MKAILLISLCFLSFSSFVDFHKKYVSKFKLVSEVEKSPVLRQNPACESWQCTSNAIPQYQCVHKVGLANYLQVCPSGTFCPWSLSKHFNTTCVPGSTVIEYGGNPGDLCSSNFDCGGLSFCNTTRGICQGLPQGSACNDQGDCDVGLTCHNVEMAATCQPVNNLGQQCGNFLTMDLCLNTLGCNFGTCVNLFSYQNGQVVEESWASLLCFSGFYESNGNPRQAVCAEAPQSPRVTLPIACTAGSYCRSRDGRYAAPCECGFNSDGNGYCPLFPGDFVYLQYLAALREYMTDPGLDTCHYLDIGMPSCLGVAHTKYEAVASYANEVLYFVAKIGNDLCVRNIITSDYWY